MPTTTIDWPDDVDPVLLAEQIAAAGWADLQVSRDGNTVIIVGDSLPSLLQLQAILAGHRTDRQRQLDKLRTKARAVWRGDGTFTQAQAQKILAGLVLTELRD